MTDTQLSQSVALIAGSDPSDMRLSQSVVLVLGKVGVAAEDDPTDTVGDPPRAGGGGALRSWRPHTPSVRWTVDDKPVRMQWDSATMTAPGGFDRAAGRIEMDQMPNASGQGSTVIARRPTGEVLWMGTILAPPKVVDGYAQIEGRGPVDIIRRRSRRLPYQIRGGQAWADRESDPFNYANSEKFSLFSKGPNIGWKMEDDISYTTGYQAGYAIFLQDWPIRRIAFTLNKSADDGNFELSLKTGNDLGTLSTEKTWALGAANPTGTLIDYTMTTTADTLSLTVVSTATATPAARRSVWLTNLRINGRNVDDDTTTSDIMADLARRCNYDPSRIETSSLLAIPLDWTSTGTRSPITSPRSRTGRGSWKRIASPQPVGEATMTGRCASERGAAMARGSGSGVWDVAYRSP